MSEQTPPADASTGTSTSTGTGTGTDVDTDPERLAERAIATGEGMDELAAMIDATRARLAAAECLGWTSIVLDMENRLEVVERAAHRELARGHAGRRQRERAARVLRLLDGDGEPEGENEVS